MCKHVGACAAMPMRYACMYVCNDWRKTIEFFSESSRREWVVGVGVRTCDVCMCDWIAKRYGRTSRP